MASLKVLILGDIIGIPGRFVFQKQIKALQQKYQYDALIVNGENSASDGRGITPKIMKFFKHHGVTAVTSGNHIWQKRDIYAYLAENRDLLRPANFPSSCPGVGVATYSVGAHTLGVINVQGRVFMRELVSCPFRAAESAISFLKSRTNTIIVDMHAETTSEKMGLAHFVDGQVSAVVGTHTHVQTADERILPGGTAFISDLGMSGALNSMIGMKKEPIIHNMLTQMPVKFEVEQTGPFILCGIIVTIDSETGKATHIERVRVVDESETSPTGDPEFQDK